MLIIIYIDDLIITRDSDVDVRDVKLLLKQKFQMDFKELRYFLGIEVIRSPSGIQLLQRKYGLDMMPKYGMTRYNPISIPLKQNTKINAGTTKLLMVVTMYRCIVGSLIYMSITRPRLKLCCGLCESIYASSKEATF